MIKLIIRKVLFAVLLLSIFPFLEAKDGVPEQKKDSELVQRIARYDAIDDFNYKPWIYKNGALEFCGVFLVTGTSLVPDYRRRSKFLEFTLITGVPAYFAYKKHVTVPLTRANQISYQSEEYRDVYLAEYEAATRQLRVVNTYTGIGLFALTFTLVKSLLPG